MPVQNGPSSEPSGTEPPATASLIPAPALASSRYNRQLLLPQLRLRGQEHLLSAKALIIGLGGLGSPAALYLAGAGVGTLGFLDGDTVEVSNLHRQIVHTESAARAGVSKVRSAAARCRDLNSEINYVCHEQRASASNLLDLVAQYDVVLDCTDNPATRYLISDVCVILGKVLVSGAAQRGEGTLVVLNSPPVSSPAEEKGPCYRCVFPRPPAPETVRGCSEIGILGPVVGTIGTLMAGEAIKIISTGRHLLHVVGDGSVQQQRAPEQANTKTQHTMLLHNTYATDPRNMFRTITLRGRRKDCVACGDDEQLAKKGLSRTTAGVVSQGRLDYQAFCGVEEDVKVLGDDRRINATEFLETYPRHGRRHHRGKRKRKHLVVDVREEHEFELGPKVRDSVNIPLSRILRHGGSAFDELELHTSPDGGMLDPESHVPAVPQERENLPSPETKKSRETTAASSSEIGPDGGAINIESHIPVTEQTGFPISPHATRQPVTDGSQIGPDGGMVNDESHIPVTEQSGFPSAHDRDLATQISSASGPDGGLLNPESHILVASQPSGVGPDGGMVDEETHIPISTQRDPASESAGPDGGIIDEESHIPMKREHSDFSRVRSTDFPLRPLGVEHNPELGGMDEEENEAQSPAAVYFVCQRGNDSQIAAQKLIEHIEAEEAHASGQGVTKRMKWGWIGDIKGGFMAMERHATW